MLEFHFNQGIRLQLFFPMPWERVLSPFIFTGPNLFSPVTGSSSPGSAVFGCLYTIKGKDGLNRDLLSGC